MKIGIVGLGLMGGSFALGVRSMNTVRSIVGCDRNPLHREQALALHLVDAVVDMEEIKRCDVIVLAIPVEGIVASLPALEGLLPTTTVIDLGSTKEKIVRAIPPSIRPNFVAAHPMTGTEFSGPTAALPDLYAGKTVVLCDTGDTDPVHVAKARDIFTHLAMTVVTMNAADHDRHAAFISHMPHILSYALANTVLQQEDKSSILTLAAGGFRDMSRLAKSSPSMWGDIFKQNKANLLEAVNIVQSQIAQAALMIENNEWEKLDRWMQEANTLHTIM